MDYEVELMQSSAAVRGLGVLSLALGLFLGYIGVYSPLQQAQAGAESISVHGGVPGAVAVTLLCSVLFLLLGKHVNRLLPLRLATATPTQFLGVAVMLVIAFASEWCFDQTLETQGYDAGHLLQRR